jgi:hypothetical protein
LAASKGIESITIRTGGNAMKILLEQSIQKGVRDCRPTKIAVAYIGSSWRSFLPDPENLDAVIISPTLGTNPSAVITLSREIGWDKLFFLDELHAKIYIGPRFAVLGSSNLTNNGLSGQGLTEACVEVQSTASLRKLNEFFDNLMARAQEQYPTTDHKKNRLKELEHIWNAALSNGVVTNKRSAQVSLKEFELLGKDHFYVTWYQPGDYEYSNEIKQIKERVTDEMHFTDFDNVQKNKWILAWQITNSDTPNKVTRPYWIYIHDIFDTGIISKDYSYPKCAIQRTDLKRPPEPFELTSKVVDAFRKAIVEEDISRFLIQEDDKPFDLNFSFNGTPLLIERMKELLA